MRRRRSERLPNRCRRGSQGVRSGGRKCSSILTDVGEVPELQEFVSNQASGLLLLGKSEFFVKRTALLRKNVGCIESEPASIQEETLSAFQLSGALEGRLSS